MRVDRRHGVEEIELRHRIGELEIRVEESADRADVLPVALENVGVDAELREHVRDDVLAEIHEGVVERFDQHLAVENVDAHRGLKQLRIGGPPQFLEQRRRDAHGVEHCGVFRLFLKAHDFPRLVGVHEAKLLRRLAAHRDRGEGHVRLCLDVLFEHLAEVHPVELIAAQDHEILVRILEEIAEVLPHGVSRALIPTRVRGRLLRGEDLDEAAGEIVELVARVDVLVQRGGIELREHIHPPQAGVDAVGNRDVHDPVFPGQRHGGLRALLGERKKTRASSPAHDDGERLVGDRGPVRWIHTCVSRMVRSAMWIVTAQNAPAATTNLLAPPSRAVLFSAPNHPTHVHSISHRQRPRRTFL